MTRRRKWFRRYRRPSVSERPPIRHLEPVRTADLLHETPGKWVAIKNGKVVEARDSFDQVILALHERDITDATVLRAPDPEREPETVGFG
jgi:hypothetical protein